jgi:lipopolysaccharide/colanic/teichoic acid biosynthesis glycosyltransferase
MLRKTKLDELPQLLNILKGQMTFVGPRPDVPGYADKLVGADQIILKLKPGITGLASLKYRNEEQILSQQPNPQLYNDEVIWPDKVRINKWYAENRTLVMDVQILFYTLFPISFDVDRFMQGGESN